MSDEISGWAYGGMAGDEKACAVLIDAGLERGAIKSPRHQIGRRADTRTDDEKASDERGDLRKKALRWARPFVEILFRRNWSVRPWASPIAHRIARPRGITSGIAMEMAEERVRRDMERQSAVCDQLGYWAAEALKPYQGQRGCTDCETMTHCETHHKVEGTYPE